MGGGGDFFPFGDGGGFLAAFGGGFLPLAGGGFLAGAAVACAKRHATSTADKTSLIRAMLFGVNSTLCA